jgi:hypothetical protein
MKKLESGELLKERLVRFNIELLQVSQFKPPKIQQQAIQARLNYSLGAEEYDCLRGFRNPTYRK